MQSMMMQSGAHTESCRVGELYIYPVKSLGGISLQQAEVLPKGLQFDRRWMLIDEQACFITQRQKHELSQVQVQLHGSGLSISLQQHQVTVPLVPQGEMLQATVWNDEVTVQEVSAAVSQHLSDMLGMNCRLVFFHEPSSRPIDAEYALSAQDQTSLSDGYPILVISQASLNDLNSRLPQPVDMRRFRPNMVVYGGQPYQEDEWRQFSIGQMPMAGVKPCARCVLTTIDPDTGKAGKEPLHTLSGYRRQGSKVLFGQNVIPLQAGSIQVGDIITWPV